MAAGEQPTSEHLLETPARPKILRRPAHLSVVAQPINIMNIAPARLELLPPHPTVPSIKSWQDDGRFAITLLAIIVILNLAFTFWLSALHSVVSPHAEALQSESSARGNHTPSDITSSSVVARPIHVLDSLAATAVTAE